jgi:hypothetical protein
MEQVIPIFIVVVFWALAFVFAFWFSQRAMRVPTETEQELAHEAAAHHEEQAPATPAH